MSFRLVDLLGGLSRLADLGFGLNPGESLRSAALAVRLAQGLGLAEEDLRAALYTALLHHVGCTGYAHETAQVYGDELAMNVAAARTDLGRVPRDVFATFIPELTQGRPAMERVRLTLTALVKGSRVGEEYTTTTCEVGRHAARRLGLSPQIQRSVYHVYELWKGGGVPDGLQGGEIPISARVARLTGIAALFDTLGGVGMAEQAVRQRAGGMLDPAVVEAFLAGAEGLLAEMAAGDPRLILLEGEPQPVVRVSQRDLAEVAAVFGDLADLKTPYTHGHSRGVARLAGDELGLTPSEVDDLEVAGLLHDVGRVAISTRVWEKPGELTRAELEQVWLHAYHSERIVAGSEQLAGLVISVGMHHERLDGSGYHRAADGSNIPMAARILAAADAYQAMTQRRPHRPALTTEQARQQLLDDTKAGALDPDAVAAVLAVAGHEGAVVPTPEPPQGLTERECEVLGLVAEGCSNAEIADRLVISPRTAEHHVQHIYAKLGTSSRAAAAVFAIEHGLLRGAAQRQDR